MSDSTISARRTPLAACLAATLCLGAPAAAVAATTWTVNTCAEDNAGSGTTGTLRYAAANAVSGDTVDMTGLACGTITLSTGAVLFAQADITVNGPGKDALTINGSNDRVLRHTGQGAFSLNDLTVANGYLHPSVGSPARGGCIVSSGKVYLSHVGVHTCRANGVGAGGYGGGVYGRGMVFAKYSDISGNVANGASNTGGGGGIFSYRDVVVAGSTVSGNSAFGTFGNSTGGGIRALLGNATVIASTISGNTAMRGGGIVQLYYSSNAQSFTLHNSTVSGNAGLDKVGGVWTNAGTIDVRNSTVAFNTAGTATSGSMHYSPGFTIDDSGASFSDPANPKVKVVTLQSSVFSNNAYGTPANHADDLGVRRAASAPAGANTTPTSGQNNLVFAPSAFVPVDTITATCPGLGPLRGSGGPTQTHALAQGSPAIDHGNNTVPYSADQRGAPFARVSGAAADIGAYEVQQGDIVFSDGFDGPPTCPG